MKQFKHVFRDPDVSVKEINNYGVCLDIRGDLSEISLTKSDVIALLDGMGGVEDTPQDNWISVDTPEDIGFYEEILCFDGCEVSIDFVVVCTETGDYYMANGTDVTHYQPLPVKPTIL
jgi:hypothetical protein